MRGKTIFPSVGCSFLSLFRALGPSVAGGATPGGRRFGFHRASGQLEIALKQGSANAGPNHAHGRATQLAATSRVAGVFRGARDGAPSHFRRLRG